jgi:hypothetical protein
MPNDQVSAEQAHRDAGDGVECTVTRARGGVRRGVSKILVISTALAVIALGAIWFVAARPAHQSMSTGAAAAATPQPSDALTSRAWDQSHLGAQGMAKCSAFRRFLRDTSRLQGEGGGTLSHAQRIVLDEELKTAQAMQPVALTPVQCGVPIG